MEAVTMLLETKIVSYLLSLTIKRLNVNVSVNILKFILRLNVFYLLDMNLLESHLTATSIHTVMEWNLVNILSNKYCQQNIWLAGNTFKFKS